jgi:TolA-binding protein
MRSAAQLMRRVSPLPPDSQRQRRVRLMLGAPRRRTTLWRLLPRPALALGILLASVAGASAMAGGGWHYARQRISWLALPRATTTTIAATPKAAHAPARHVATPKREAPLAEESAASTVAAEAPAAPVVVAPPVVETPVVETPVAIETAPVVEAPSIVARHDRRATAKRKVALAEKPAPSAPPAPAVAAPTGPGAELMVEAMEARRAGKMARAERLLAEYRQRYPNGVLQEEALALSLEAAALRGDTDSAADLAQEYLRRFPAGRFGARVRQVVKTLPR